MILILYHYFTRAIAKVKKKRIMTEIKVSFITPHLRLTSHGNEGSDESTEKTKDNFFSDFAEILG